jgi:hypothetical protein
MSVHKILFGDTRPEQTCNPVECLNAIARLHHEN